MEIKLDSKSFWIGCSGFSYKDWVGSFYPENVHKKDFLSYYARFFNTVEINTTFYEWPTKSQIVAWNNKVSKNFKFSFKMPRIISHEKKLAYAEKDVFKFVDLLEPVIRANKLGVILVQLPPSMGVNIKKLKSFLEILPKHIKFAIEFRRQSWLTERTFVLLKDFQVAYVIVDEPLLPPITKITADFTYIRFHGKGKKIWYYYNYSEEELKNWAGKIKDITAHVKEIYIYFNNHFRGYAPKNALLLRKILGVGDNSSKHTQIGLSEFFRF